MPATQTPLPDLIELSGLTENTRFDAGTSTGPRILGLVDTGTYSDEERDNTATFIEELNETQDTDRGILTIDGVAHSIELVAPDDDVVVIRADGTAFTVPDDGDDSLITFIMATPPGGATRYFAVFDDRLGDIGPLAAIRTGRLDYDPAGDDVKIRVAGNDDVRPMVCFAAGTRIATPLGPRPVERLRRGMAVLTLDRGVQPILDAPHRIAPADCMRTAPVRIAAGALGTGLPSRPLRLSPQHRVMLRSRIARRLFSTTEVLVPAIRLVGLPGIARDPTERPVAYHHVLCHRHEILFAEGAPVESLLRGPQSLRGLDPGPRTLLKLAPAIAARPARPIRARRADLSELLACHARTGRALIAP